MVRRSWRGLALCVAAATPFTVPAQGLFELDPGGQTGPIIPTELGGTPAIDLVVLRGDSPGAPLKNAFVKQGSERVELNGKVLRRNSDYTIDYEAGIVYVMKPQKAGDSLVVSYRYDPEAAQQQRVTGQAFGGFSGFKFDFTGNGSLRGIFGFGMTERSSDGSVVNSNLYGLNNSFSFGGNGKLSGVFLLSERQQMDAKSGMGGPDGPATVPTGKSRFMLQNLQVGFGGGTISADYQDISKNFSGFGAVQDSGIDPALVQQLRKEAGLERFGLGMSGVKLGGMSMGANYRNVEDGDGSIDWRSFSLGQGDPTKGNGFALSWDARSVDKNFTRFNDLREGDRQQLMKEKGMLRENLAAHLRGGLGQLTFNQNKIQDESGSGIYRRSLEVFDGASADKSKFHLSLGDQHAEDGFSRIGSLTDPEKGAYGRELGLRRQWASLSIGYWDPKSPLKYATNSIRSDEGDMTASRFSLGGKNWGFEHLNTSIDEGFRALAALPDKEKDEHITTIAQMYQPDAKGLKKEQERGWLLQSAGIERELMRFSMSPSAGLDVRLESLEVHGVTDGLTVHTGSVTGKNFTLGYRNQQMGDQFAQLNNMLEFERRELGSIIGLDRTDFVANFTLGGKKLGFSQMKIDSPDGGATRQTISASGKNFDIVMNARQVDSEFSSVNQLLDPEKDLLHSLQGFSERDIKGKIQIVPGMWLDLFWFDAVSKNLDQTKMIHNASFRYAPTKDTEISYLKNETRNDDPFELLLGNNLERLSLKQKLGKLGTVGYMQEDQAFTGLLGNQDDWTKRHFSYETKLDPKTTVRTDQIRTEFENGAKEQVSQNTFSSQVAKNVGVSVTDVNINRTDADDETKRNYGFWVDLGKGLRFSYGYARHLEGENGTLTSGMSLSSNPMNNLQPNQVNNVQPGQVGNFNVGGGYGVNEWDASGRTQSFSKVQFGTIKPMRVGFLEDVRFNFGMDTQADYANWLRENRLIQFGARIGANQLMYEYKSQIHQSGSRAIDRTFRVETPQDANNWLVAKLLYKVRTLPWDEQVMIRDFSITAKPSAGLSLTHKLQTNPEGPAQSNVILGTTPLPIKKNEWRVDYKIGKDFTLGGSYDEIINEQQKSMARKAGVNVLLFENIGSPLNLYYGLEQNDLGGSRKTVHRYHLRFDQRPGPNQMLSFFISNESFEHFLADGARRNNWTMRLNYQLKF